jgi:hypothetical protein
MLSYEIAIVVENNIRLAGPAGSRKQTESPACDSV